MSDNSITYNRILSKGIEANLPGIEDGKLRFTTDTGRLYMDTGNSRIEISDFIKGKTKAEIIGTLAPLPKFYLASDTGELYYHASGEWKTVKASDAINASTAEYAVESGHSVNASTANYATNSGTATYANNAANAGSATNASTASYANNAGSATSATNASTATYAVNAGTATKATNADNATSATNASTATVSKDAISDITRNGLIFTATRKDGSTFTFDQQDNNTTYGKATTASDGLLPKLDGGTAKYLRADGSWQTPPNSTYTANNGVGISGNTFYNSGVRAISLDGNNLNVNTNGTTTNLTIPFATNASTASYATNAGTAARATADGSGNTITSTYAPKASPAFTGSPTTPDVAAGDSSTKIANTKFVSGAIASAISDVTQFDFQIVTELPATGVKGVIYLKELSSGETGNIYEEYIWITNKYEKLGTTQIDLSDYVNDVVISGTGNAVTGFSKDGNTLTLTKGSTFLTSIPNYYATTATYTAGTGLSKSGTAFSVNQTAAMNLSASTVAYATKAGSANNASTADYAKNAIASITRSGLTFTATKVNGDTFTFDQQDNNTTYGNFTSAAAGLTPASGGGTAKYLRADGSWQTPPNTTYANVTSATAGLAPAGGSGTTKYLRQDGSWQVPPNDNTTYSFSNNAATLGWNTASTIGTVGGVDLTVKMPPNPNTNSTYALVEGTANGTVNFNNNGTTANVPVHGLGALAYEDSLSKADVGLGNVDNTADANKNVASATNASTANYAKNAIKSITRSGLTFTATREDNSTFTFTQQDNNTTYGNVTSATAGLAPAGGSGTTKYLRQDGTWQVPPDNNTTYGNFTSAVAGLAPASGGGTAKYLRADGTWQTPPNDNTTYGNVSTAAAGLAPKVTSTTGYLKGDGTWAAPPNDNTTYSAGTGLTLTGTAFSINQSASTVAYATNAGTAARATADGSGNTITSTYAPKASPAFTGSPTTPDVAAGDSSTKIANTKFVTSAISTAIAGVTQFDYEVVTSLPTTGVKGKIYLIALTSSETDNEYEEYIWVGSKYEKLGTTQMDLSNYVNNVVISGTGNAVTAMTKSGNTLTLTKGTTFPTTNTTYANFTSAAAGLAPASGGGTAKYLRADGTWVAPPNTTYAANTWATSAANGTSGLFNTTPPKDGYNTKFLRADGSWVVPTNTNSTYALATGTANGTVNFNSNGTTANVSVYGLKSAAYTESTAYAASNHTHTFASLTSKPTTLAGYGITDASPSTHTHSIYSTTAHNHDGTYLKSIPNYYATTATLAGYSTTAHTHSNYAASNHTHDISIATSTGTNQLTMAANTKYALTAGGKSYIFTTPADNNTTYDLSPYQKKAEKINNAATADYATSAGSAASATNASTATYASSAGAVAWGNVSGKPSTYAPVIGTGSTQAAAGNHTHAQYATTAVLSGYISTASKGANNGVAELDSSGKVPSSQLPSFVDDVLEYIAKSSFPTTGETGKIYVDTSTNLTYRWSGTAYVEISPSLALGETSSTAYRGDRGAIAYNHSQAAHAPSNAQPNQNAFSNIAVGSTTIAADTTTDTLTLVAGSNVTITPDATNDKVTITATNTTYGNVSTAAAGLAPKVTSTTGYLKGDGTWATPTNTTYAANTWATSAANGTSGLFNTTPPKDGYNTKFLRADGTWVVPNNTTYDLSPYQKKAEKINNAATADYASSAGAVAWGNVSGKPTTYAPVIGTGSTQAAAGNHTHTFASLTSKPTTISGYGITDFKSASNGAVAPNSSTVNQLGYTNGTSAIYGQSDGALFAQAYSGSWVAQIYQDYRSGHIAVRSNNNGTWTDWGRVFDTRNVSGSGGITINSTTAGITIGVGTVANATNAATATYASSAGAVAWGNVSSKPSTFAPIIGSASTQAAAGNHTHGQYATTAHNHDGVYLKSVPAQYATTATYTAGSGLSKSGTAFSINANASTCTTSYYPAVSCDFDFGELTSNGETYSH